MTTVADDLGNEPERADVVVIDQLSFTVRASKFRFAATMMKRTMISLATEFALRLIRLVPNVTAEDLAGFFGFREAEVAVLVQDMLETALVLEQDGKFQLSARGLEAVSPLGDVELFASEEITAHLVFDLIAFAPIDEAELDKALTKSVPELPLTDRERAANALIEAPRAFELHFQEWLQRTRRRTDDMRFRSIEDVQQIKSMAIPIAVPITYRLDEPYQAEADFSALRQVGIPHSRNPLIEALSAAIQRIGAPSEADWALTTLASIEGGVLTRAGLSDLAGVAAWIRAIISKDNSGAPTIPMFGSAVGERCRPSLLDWNAGLSGAAEAAPFYWLPPEVDHWGRSVAFDSLLRELRGSAPGGFTLLARTDFSQVDRKRIVRNFAPVDEQTRFDRCIALPDGSPRALEILVRPGTFALALVHTADPLSGYPLPVGYLTSEPAVVRELCLYLGGILQDVDAQSVMWQGPTETAALAFDTAMGHLWSV